MHFDKPKYMTEMEALINNAFHAFRQTEDAEAAFVVSIWTDPDAAASSVSVETRQHSFEFLGTRDRINDSPADFRYRDIAECDHRSFPALWEEATSGECWDLLEPALIEVANDAIRVLSNWPVEEDAVLGVNSRRDWFEHRFALQSAA